MNSRPDRSASHDTEDYRFQELLHSVYEGILIAGLRGDVEIANSRAAELFGRESVDLCHARIQDLISGFTDEILQNIVESLEKEKHVLLEASCVRGNGSLFPGEIAVHNIYLGPDSQLCFSVRDVTQRIEAESRLEDAQDELVRAEKTKARMETITTLAHEINNPLQMLLGMVEADNNVRYAAPLNRITTVIQQLRLQEELRTVKYAGTASRYEIPAADVKPAQGDRLLIVDDEITLRRFFESMIEAKLPGIRIETAANGQQALEAFRREHPAVIVLDIAMPVMDGEETFRELRRICKDSKWEMPAVVFCTGYTPPESIRQALQRESLHTYLPKPVTGAALVEAVRNRFEFHALSHGAPPDPSADSAAGGD